MDKRLAQVTTNLDASGIPEEAASVLVGRVTIFAEMYDGDEAVLVKMLRKEVEDLVEDAAVAVNCLLLFEPGWELMARRLSVDYAVLRGGTAWLQETGGDADGYRHAGGEPTR